MRYAVVLMILLALCLPTLAQDSIALGDEVSGELTEAEARYTFDGEQGQFVTITLVSEDFDSYLRLIGPDERDVATDDDSAGSLDSRIGPLALPANGPYTIVATSLSGTSSGSYTLTLEADTVSVIEYGQTIEAELTESQLSVNYRFQGTAGDVVAINLRSDVFDSFLELSGPENLSRSDDDSGGSLNAQIAPLTLPATGTYVITARSLSGSATGAYSLSLSKTDMTALTVGEPLEVRVEQDGAYFTFEAETNQQFTIAVDSNNAIDTLLTLRGPDGYQVASDDDSGGTLDPAIRDYLATQAGTYTIYLQPYSEFDTGSLTISVEEVLPLSLDEGPQTARLTDKRNRQALIFTAVAGEAVRLTLTIDGRTASPSLTLNQDGSVISTASFSSVQEVSLVMTPANDGRVAVIIDDYSYSNVNITVSLERMAEK